MEIPEGNHNPLDISEADLEDEHDDGVDEDPFQDAGVKGGFEESLAHALDLNGGVIKIEVAGLFRLEASLKNYFEWKTMVEARKVLFVKLKLKGTTLQWWEGVAEQRAQQGKAKISTGASNKVDDGLSRQSSLLAVMCTQVVGFNELKNKYETDPYLKTVFGEIKRANKLGSLTMQVA